jgi:hypothetical protein
MTTRDPDSGVRDLDTLRLIAGYRGRPRGTIDFGVYAGSSGPAPSAWATTSSRSSSPPA